MEKVHFSSHANSSTLSDFLQRFKVVLHRQAELELSSKLFQVTVAKGEFLLLAGEPADRLWIIERGLCRVFYQTQDGVEYTRALAAEGMPLGAYSNALKGQASEVFIEAIEDTSLLEIQYRDLQKLFLTDPVFETLGRKIVEELFVMRERREAQLVLLNAKQRLMAFDRDFPELRGRVSKKLLANFLGIKPESLSRILSSAKLQ